MYFCFHSGKKIEKETHRQWLEQEKQVSRISEQKE
jgi:hypothetical protein